jgi:hypothetical protein
MPNPLASRSPRSCAANAAPSLREYEMKMRAAAGLVIAGARPCSKGTTLAGVPDSARTAY